MIATILLVHVNLDEPFLAPRPVRSSKHFVLSDLNIPNRTYSSELYKAYRHSHIGAKMWGVRFASGALKPYVTIFISFSELTRLPMAEPD